MCLCGMFVRTQSANQLREGICVAHMWHTTRASSSDKSSCSAVLGRKVVKGTLVTSPIGASSASSFLWAFLDWDGFSTHALANLSTVGVFSCSSLCTLSHEKLIRSSLLVFLKTEGLFVEHSCFSSSLITTENCSRISVLRASTLTTLAATDFGVPRANCLHS